MATFAYLRALPRISDMRSLAQWLAVGLVFTVPWENAVHLGPLGRISKLVGFAAFVIWLLSVIGRRRLRDPDRFQKAVFVFLVWNGLTLFWSLDFEATMSGFRTYLLLFVMILMLWDLFDSERVVKAAIQAYVLGAFVAATSVIVGYVRTPPVRFEEHLRINALGYETDGIALIIAVAAPAAWFLASGPQARSMPILARLVNYAYVPVGVLAIGMTGTRGATLASIPTAILILASLRRTRGRGRVVALAAIAIAVALLVQFAPRGPLERIGTATTLTEEEGSLSDRWGIWLQSGALFLDHPLSGVGLDAHRSAVAAGRADESAFKKADKEAHNTYVSVLAETGLPGFLLFGWVLLSVVARARSRLDDEAGYWYAQLSVLAIGAMSLSLEDSKSVWIFTSLAVASAVAQHGTEPLTAAAASLRTGALRRLDPVVRPPRPGART